MSSEFTIPVRCPVSDVRNSGSEVHSRNLWHFRFQTLDYEFWFSTKKKKFLELLSSDFVVRKVHSSKPGLGTPSFILLIAYQSGHDIMLSLGEQNWKPLES